LSSIERLLENNGDTIADTEGAQSLTPQQRGARSGMLFAVVGLLLIPLTFLLRAFVVDKMIYLLIPASICFLAGIVRVLYSLFLEESNGESMREAFSAIWHPQGRLAGVAPVALPPRRASVNDFASVKRDTDEIAMPPQSVTERTTQLFDERGSDSV
jgi:hypothetical protein